MTVIEWNRRELPPCPAAAPGDPPEHDMDLYETNRTEHVYKCMLCDMAIRMPLDFGPEDAKGRAS